MSGRLYKYDCLSCNSFCPYNRYRYNRQQDSESSQYSLHYKLKRYKTSDNANPKQYAVMNNVLIFMSSYCLYFYFIYNLQVRLPNPPQKCSRLQSFLCLFLKQEINKLAFLSHREGRSTRHQTFRDSFF